ncbi:MAG: cobaltochelatase subunit CobN [Oscillatoriales cyanobacterium C42_A2020_001]|nr:cobaltochelatase subunit CobN [Leptolyngbyaceae cyanobacterium C42_A2020_001]
MHRLAATPGGWNPDEEGVILIQQTPAPIVVLTAADTDVQTLASAVERLPQDFPPIRVTNLLNLQQYLTIDTYIDEVLCHAQVIIVRVLGGRAYWSYGLERLKELADTAQVALFVLPGDDRPDLDLISHSTVPLAHANQLWHYFTEGGVDNVTHALQFVASRYLGKLENPPPPQPVPQVGRYGQSESGGAFRETPVQESAEKQSRVGVLFYRAHYLAGNTAPIDALCQALCDRQLEPVPIFVSSLRDPDVQAEVLQWFQPKDELSVDLVVNTTSFAIADLQETRSQESGVRSQKDSRLPILDSGLKQGSQESEDEGEEEEIQNSKFKVLQLLNLQSPITNHQSPIPLSPSAPPSSPSLPPPPPPSLWSQLNVPVLQVILSSGTVEQWQTQLRGLSPRDMAMNVALPEVDGRIITRAVSFKAVQTRNARLETDVVTYQPVGDRIEFVAELAANWIHLRRTPVEQRKVALILANYPTRDGRLANGVGLDTPASVVEILQALQQAGYQVSDLPQTSDELIRRLTSTVTNDPEGRALRPISQSLAQEEYAQYFATLPEAVRQGICDRWGDIKYRQNFSPFPIPGIQLGNIFVGIQPARGYDQDPSLNYHAPDLEPTHEYLAFYHWLRSQFGAQAIVHVGKHGNLEWLPGKGIALSNSCYPEVALGALPHLYPFIVNDPGEGSQAKRRSHAVILDHLTPPMTRAELYGSLLQLEALIDEYYEAQSLDPARLDRIRDRILQLLEQENLVWELEARRQKSGDKSQETEVRKESQSGESFDSWGEILARMDGYLCELKEAQIRDGLHIFGKCPEGTQLRDLIVAIARSPTPGRIGLTRAIAQTWNLDFDPLAADPTTPLPQLPPLPHLHHPTPPRTIGDCLELLEHHAAHLVEQLLSTSVSPSPIPYSPSSPPLAHELTWIATHLLPALQHTHQELTNLLRGLNGEYVPSGASGAPTRGRPDVLPTGRNFYSVDIRGIPTETAWDTGRKAAEALIERYVQDNGEYPKTLGLSIWGTSTMRTGGDDIAEALALLGVQPIWDGMARRVIDFEIVPLSVLGRPRVDVTLRISGFFRDAFANLIDLFDQAVAAVAQLDEPATQNPLAAQVQQDCANWQAQGLSFEQAQTRSRYRVFGSKPGAYGAGLQGLLEAQNWTDDADLARAYINWSSYAYTKQGMGHSAPEAFEQRLKQMQVVLHNQDNREHDLLDSDDYYQFQGGLAVAVRSLQGKNPQTYFGDHSRPENPKVRRLQEEIARVYRSRVINPKWIAGVMRHGYKGAFEMAATVDYLFAYDATAGCVEDFMYQGVADAYVFDPAVQAFIQQKNPWALRDMAERLLEAHQRGLWQTASCSTLDHLRAIANQAEGAIETQT